MYLVAAGFARSDDAHRAQSILQTMGIGGQHMQLIHDGLHDLHAGMAWGQRAGHAIGKLEGLGSLGGTVGTLVGALADYWWPQQASSQRPPFVSLRPGHQANLVVVTNSEQLPRVIRCLLQQGGELLGEPTAMKKLTK